jgi:hypothetical protein
MSQNFVIEPDCVRYSGALEFQDLVEHLEESSSTTPIEVRNPEDVLLSLDGLVQQRYRFTPFGLYTLCRRLSPNLGSVIADLSGISNRPSAKLRSDPVTAALVLNAVIKLRFEGALLGSRMIIDPARGTIDGIVGSRYEFLSNYELFQKFNKFVDKWGGEFLSASLVGRRMLIRYCCGEGFENRVGEYSLGWAFSNSETGQSAVRAGLLIVDQWGRSSMRSIIRKQHTKSLSKQGCDWVIEKLDKASLSVNWDAISSGMESLFNKELPRFKSLVDSARLADKLATDLGKRISKQAARDTSRTVYAPSSNLARPTSPLPSPDGRKTYFDLYSVFTDLASSLQPQDQENVECLAYELLRGRYIPFEN